MSQQLPPGIKNWRECSRKLEKWTSADVQFRRLDWRTKGCEGWAKEWLKTEIDGQSVGGVTVTVKDTEGDCEVGMRKSKCVELSQPL